MLRIKALKVLVWHFCRGSQCKELKKKNERWYMMNELMVDQDQERTDSRINTVGWRMLCVLFRQKNAIAGIGIFDIKKVFLWSMPPSRIFYTPLLIICLSAIETLVCHRKIEFDTVYFLRFCTKYDMWFQNTVLNSTWHCLQQLLPKKKKTMLKLFVNENVLKFGGNFWQVVFFFKWNLWF